MTSAKHVGQRLCIRQRPPYGRNFEASLNMSNCHPAHTHTHTPRTHSRHLGNDNFDHFLHAAVFYLFEFTALIGNETNTCYDLLKWLYIVFRFLLCCFCVAEFCIFSQFPQEAAKKPSSLCASIYYYYSIVELWKWSS